MPTQTNWRNDDFRTYRTSINRFSTPYISETNLKKKKELLLGNIESKRKQFSIKKALKTRFGKGAWMDFNSKVENAAKRDIYSKKGKLWLK